MIFFQLFGCNEVKNILIKRFFSFFCQIKENYAIINQDNLVNSIYASAGSIMTCYFGHNLYSQYKYNQSLEKDLTVI